MSIEFFQRTPTGVVPAPCQRFVFPAGEQTIKVTGSLDGTQIAVVKGADANDYLALQMWAEQVEGTSVAVVPYLPAARADKDRPRGADYYAAMIRSYNTIDAIYGFDPHSPYMPSQLGPRHISVMPTAFVADAIRARDIRVAGVIIPDAGATSRSSALATALGVPSYQALKHRNPSTGRLSNFSCDPIPDEDGLLLVADDICDGGGTFIGLADATGLPKERLALYVSHGVFSSGASRLRDRYSLIFTTDSYPAIDPNVADFSLPVTDYLIGLIP